MMAFATRYEVSTQVASSTVAERLPAMCGSATLATLVSSTSMNVASITVIAMIHGLMAGGLMAGRVGMTVLLGVERLQLSQDMRQIRARLVVKRVVRMAKMELLCEPPKCFRVAQEEKSARKQRPADAAHKVTRFEIGRAH